jgi:hypothetical protein
MSLGIIVAMRRKNKETLWQMPSWTMTFLSSGKWLLVAFATKKHYANVITSMNEGQPTVKFVRRVKSTSTFI